MGGLKGTTTTGRVYEKDQLKFKFSMNYLEVNVFHDFGMFSFRYQLQRQIQRGSCRGNPPRFDLALSHNAHFLQTHRYHIEKVFLVLS